MIDFNRESAAAWRRYESACRLYDGLIKARDKKKEKGAGSFAGITVETPRDNVGGQDDAARAVADLMRADVDAYAERAIDRARSEIISCGGALIDALRNESIRAQAAGSSGESK
jgi:hypothetical protein